MPSRMPSAKPAMVVMGVLSSWETLATNSLRFCSAWARESAMALKATASSPISSFRAANWVTRVPTSPRANLWAASFMTFRGSVIRWTVTEQMTREMRRTTAAVTRKSWMVLVRKEMAEVASAAMNSSPVGELVAVSPVRGSMT